MAFSQAQRKSLAVGIGLLLAASAIILLLWWASYLPGFAGEFFSMVLGFMFTPVVLDISLFIIGLSLVLWLNKVRLARDGDEFVYLEQVDAPEVAGLPAEARTAIYQDPPAVLVDHPEFAAIEGAIELGDFAEATDLLMELDDEVLDDPEVVALRYALARKQGHAETADLLRERLEALTPDHPFLRQTDWKS